MVGELSGAENLELRIDQSEQTSNIAAQNFGQAEGISPEVSKKHCKAICLIHTEGDVYCIEIYRVFDASFAQMKTSSAQQALLGLERSTLPVEDQIDNAFEILGLSTEELDESEDSEDVDKEVHGITFAPKEEWILRWLLKRIRSTIKTEPKYVYQQILVFIAKKT